jgi:hypothetical protein
VWVRSSPPATLSGPFIEPFLPGSIATSNGMRVRLELRDMPRFSLFPGQIVCVQGQNPSGHCLVARRIIAAVPPPMPRSPPASSAFGALSAVVASGPFTCAGDLSYEPFAAGIIIVAPDSGFPIVAVPKEITLLNNICFDPLPKPTEPPPPAI